MKIILKYLLIILFFCGSLLWSEDVKGIVTDKNLLWQKCNYGENPDDCSGEALKMEWKEAGEACKKLTLGKKKWRLPEIEELSSLIKCKDSKVPAFRETCGEGNVDIVAADSMKFPTIQRYSYWSNTVRKNNDFYHLFVEFKKGLSNYDVSSRKMLIKCVSQIK